MELCHHLRENKLLKKKVAQQIFTFITSFSMLFDFKIHTQEF